MKATATAVEVLVMETYSGSLVKGMFSWCAGLIRSEASVGSGGGSPVFRVDEREVSG